MRNELRMILGLLQRSLRETRGTTLAFATGLFLFELLLGIILPTFQKDFSDKLMQVEFLQKIIAALLGAEVGSFAPSTALAMLGWVHPFVLALVWAYAIVICTRFPSGALEAGTLDVWLSLPVTRAGIQCGELFAFMLTGGVLVTAGLLGNQLGGWVVGSTLNATAKTLLLVTFNLYALALAVGGMATFFSCVCDRRGRAMGIAFAILLASFFQSSMSSFNETVKRCSVVSLLTYYRPYFVLQGTREPWGDVAILLGIGTLFWLAGLFVLSRRDLATA